MGSLLSYISSKEKLRKHEERRWSCRTPALVTLIFSQMWTMYMRQSDTIDPWICWVILVCWCKHGVAERKARGEVEGRGSIRGLANHLPSFQVPPDIRAWFSLRVLRSMCQALSCPQVWDCMDYCWSEPSPLKTQKVIHLFRQSHLSRKHSASLQSTNLERVTSCPMAVKRYLWFKRQLHSWL